MDENHAQTTSHDAATQTMHEAGTLAPSDAHGVPSPDNAEELPADTANPPLDGDGDQSTDAPQSGDGQTTGATLNPNDDMPATHATVGMSQQQRMATLNYLGQEAILLMGLSFILGSLFTVFVLLVLDFMRRNSDPQN